MWASQQAPRTRRRTRSHRIEGKVAESAPQAITPHYRVNGRDSWRARAGRDGRLTAEERPTRTKSRRKTMGSPIFPGIEHIIACGPKPARARRDLEPQFSVELNRPLTTSNQFHAISARRPRQTDSENALQRSGVASRTLSRRYVTKTMEPGNMRLNARYGISAAGTECA